MPRESILLTFILMKYSCDLVSADIVIDRVCGILDWFCDGIGRALLRRDWTSDAQVALWDCDFLLQDCDFLVFSITCSQYFLPS